MSRQVQKKPDFEKQLYDRQNRMIHMARAQLGMDLDTCRELARQISGKASISSLTIDQRSELIKALNDKGANVNNPSLQNVPDPDQSQEKADEVYPNRLEYWNKRFPSDRPGYATNRQLAWIQSLWELDFNDGRAGKGGLRGFIYRQTQNLENGPVSDLAFLRDEHVMAVITPLKEKARQGMGS